MIEMTQTELDGMSTLPARRRLHARRAWAAVRTPGTWPIKLKAEVTRRIAVESASRHATVRRATACTDKTDRLASRPNHRIYDALRDMDERHDALMTD